MNFQYHKNFCKQILKLPIAKQQLCQNRIQLFWTYQNHPLLNRHALSGKYTNYFSLNVGGDLRVVYKQVGTDTIEFVTVGTHSQLDK